MHHAEPVGGPDASDLSTPDLSSIGRRRFLQGVGAATGATALGSVVPQGFAHAALPEGASAFTPLPKGVRLADTREPSRYPFTRVADNHIRVQVRDRAGVPATATAVVLTVTGVKYSSSNTYITVYPTGAPSVPTVSNLNLRRPNEVNANLVVVKVGDQHSVDVFQYSPCHTIVDVLGYFEPVESASREGRFVGLPSARRALDTRPGFVTAGSFTTIDLTSIVPSEAASAVINLTALANPDRGFFTAVPASVTTVPETSSLNIVFPDDVRAAAVIVPVETVGGRRLIKVYASTTAQLLCDVTGYFTNSTAPLSQTGLFVSLDPVRVLDTRIPDPTKRLWPRWVVESTVPSPASSAAAVVMNVTSVDTRGRGYLTVSGARLPIPGTSNLNWVSENAVVPNLVFTPVTAGYGFQAYNHSGGHVLADLAGYFLGASQTAVLPKYVNPAPPPAPPTWVLRVPRLGLTSTVESGDANAITNAGKSWHWSGSGNMGEVAHVGLFAHRTSAGGPYRYLHLLQPGDTWTITTGDRREFTYRMVRRDLTNSNVNNILAATRLHPGTTTSLIACTRTDWLPTSIYYRIIVTGELVSVREF